MFLWPLKLSVGMYLALANEMSAELLYVSSRLKHLIARVRPSRTLFASSRGQEAHNELKSPPAWV